MRMVKWGLLVILLLILAAVGFVYLAPERALGMALNAERERAGLVRKQITLPDGLRYVYLEGGSGEPLMLLHGFGANKDNFTRIARLLTPHYHLIVPDHLGFGESAHPQGADYSAAAQAERLHGFAAALGLQKLHLGGSSMGGQIAMLWALQYPDQVQSLWLLDPGGVWKTAPQSELNQRLASGASNPLMAKTEDEFAGIFHFAMRHPPFVPRPMLDVLARERIANFALEAKIFPQLRGDSLEERIRGLPTKTLIVWGEQDRAIHPGTGPLLHALLPSSQLILMPDTGHLPMIERPTETARDYLAFRTGVRA